MFVNPILGKGVPESHLNTSGTVSPSIQLLLVDAYPMVREALRILIDGWPDIRVVSEASGQAEVLNALKRMKPSLLVVSDSGPAGVFRDRLGEIVQAAGEAPVIFLTGSGDPDVEASALETGAKWIVRKDDGPHELRRAIESVHLGETWTGPSDGRARQGHRVSGAGV